MLKCEVKTGDDKLREEIERVKNMFDKWFETTWSNRCTREQMLSEKSPVEHIYYKMTKSFDEVKRKYPYEAKEECSSCGEYFDNWMQLDFSFYNWSDDIHTLNLCKECANKLKNGIEEVIN